MTGKDLFDSTEFIGEDLIYGAEFDKLQPGPWKKILSTAAVLALLAGGGFWVWHTLDPLPPPQPTHQEVQTPVTAEPRTEQQDLVLKTESHFDLTMAVSPDLAQDLYADWSNVMQFCFQDGASAALRKQQGYADPTSIIWFLSVSGRRQDQPPEAFYNWGIYPRDLLLGWDDHHFYTLHRPDGQMEDAVSFQAHEDAGLAMLQDFLDRNGITPAPDWARFYRDGCGNLKAPEHPSVGAKPALRMDPTYHLLLEVPADLSDNVVANEQDGWVFSFYDRVTEARLPDPASCLVWGIRIMTKEDFRAVPPDRWAPGQPQILGDDREHVYLLELPEDRDLDLILNQGPASTTSYGRHRVLGYHLLRSFLRVNRINPDPEWDRLYFEAALGFDQLSSFYDLAARVLDRDTVDLLHGQVPMMEVLPTEPTPVLTIRSLSPDAPVEMDFDPYDPDLPLRRMVLPGLQDHLLPAEHRETPQEAAAWWLQTIFPGSTKVLSDSGAARDGLTCTFSTVVYPMGIPDGIENRFDAVHITVDPDTGCLLSLVVSAYPCVNLQPNLAPMTEDAVLALAQAQLGEGWVPAPELVVLPLDSKEPESLLLWQVHGTKGDVYTDLYFDAYTGQLLLQSN